VPEVDDCVNSVMHLEGIIECVWKSTWRPGLCELGGHDCASLEIHYGGLNLVNLVSGIEPD